MRLTARLPLRARGPLLRGHGAELTLLEPPVPAGHLTEVGGHRAESLTRVSAVGSEMEEPVKCDA